MYEYMHDDSEAPAIVIDNGSKMMKIGFSDDNTPRILPTVVGSVRGNNCAMFVRSHRVAFCGHDALGSYHKTPLRLSYPIEDGLVTSWDQVESIWHHAFYNELRAAPEDHSVLLTETPLNPKANREKIVQIMFETFNVPKCHIALDSVLSLYASGRTTGTVLDIGHDSTRCVPIYDGYALPDAINRVKIGGRALSECAENNSDLKKFCTLPDGFVIEVGTQRFQCAEALFQPSLLCGSALFQEPGLESLDTLVLNSLRQCHIDLHKDLCQNVILAGGSSMFPGIDKRLEKELTHQIKAPYRQFETRLGEDFSKQVINLIGDFGGFVRADVNVVAPRSNNSAWLGGSVASSLPSFQDMWITKEEYDESGPCVVHRKPFSSVMSHELKREETVKEKELSDTKTCVKDIDYSNSQPVYATE